MSRDRRKRLGSSTAAAKASAVSWPTPGMLISQRQASQTGGKRLLNRMERAAQGRHCHPAGIVPLWARPSPGRLPTLGRAERRAFGNHPLGSQDKAAATLSAAILSGPAMPFSTRSRLPIQTARSWPATVRRTSRPIAPGRRRRKVRGRGDADRPYCSRARRRTRRTRGVRRLFGRARRPRCRAVRPLVRARRRTRSQTV
jgi:hypothetical protein